MPLPRAYLIDSSIYIFRAWHIYDDSITDTHGKPSNAVFGFSDFLFQIIKQKQPQHIACAFDASQTASYRRELYPETRLTARLHRLNSSTSLNSAGFFARLLVFLNLAATVTKPTTLLVPLQPISGSRVLLSP